MLHCCMGVSRPDLGQHRIFGNVSDDGRDCQGGAIAISTQAAGQIKSEAVHMVLLHPPDNQ